MDTAPLLALGSSASTRQPLSAPGPARSCAAEQGRALAQSGKAVPVATPAGARAVVPHAHPYRRAVSRRPGRRPRSRRPRGAARWSPTPARCGRPPRPRPGAARPVRRRAPGRPEATTRGAHQALQIRDSGRGRQFGAGPRRAARRPWRAFPPACAPPPPRPPPAPRRRRRVGAREHPARLGEDHHAPTRGGPPCRAVPGRAARARGSAPAPAAARERSPGTAPAAPITPGSEQEDEAHDLFDGRGLVRDDTQREGREDHRARPARSPVPIPTGAARTPARARPRRCTGRRARAVRRPARPPGAGSPSRTPSVDHRQRAGPAPQGQQAQPYGEHHRHRPPHDVLAQGGLQHHTARPAASSAQSRRTRAGASGGRGSVHRVRRSSRSTVLSLGTAACRASAERTGRHSAPGPTDPRPAADAAERRGDEPRHRRPYKDGRRGGWRTRCSRKPCCAWAEAPPAIPGG